MVESVNYTDLHTNTLFPLNLTKIQINVNENTSYSI